MSHLNEQNGLLNKDEVTTDKACGSVNLEVFEGKSDVEIKELTTI